MIHDTYVQLYILLHPNNWKSNQDKTNLGLTPSISFNNLQAPNFRKLKLYFPKHICVIAYACCIKVLMMPKIKVIQSLLQVQVNIKRSREKIHVSPLFVKRIS